MSPPTALQGRAAGGRAAVAAHGSADADHSAATSVDVAQRSVTVLHAR
ncbi:hypothetical protein ACFPM0_09325 [Pseudonocardia sulfidoxydans]